MPNTPAHTDELHFLTTIRDTMRAERRRLERLLAMRLFAMLAVSAAVFYLRAALGFNDATAAAAAAVVGLLAVEVAMHVPLLAGVIAASRAERVAPSRHAVAFTALATVAPMSVPFWIGTGNLAETLAFTVAVSPLCVFVARSMFLATMHSWSRQTAQLALAQGRLGSGSPQGERQAGSAAQAESVV